MAGSAWWDFLPSKEELVYMCNSVIEISISLGMLFPLEAGRGKIPCGLPHLWDPFLVLLVRGGWNSGFA